MRKFVALMSLAAICSATALADLPGIGKPDSKPQLRAATAAEFVPVKRIARVTADGQVGPWIDVENSSGIAQGCGGEMIYDCAEMDMADPAQWAIGCGVYGAPCPGCVGAPSMRWYYATACMGILVDDMTVKPGWEGGQADRVAYFWNWAPEANGGPIGGESCIIALFTTEDVSVDCIAPAMGNTFDGIIYNFGVLPDGAGYYWTDTREGLCNSGLWHDLPADGQGGTLMVPTTRFVDLTDYTMATCSQMMMWGTMDPAQVPPGTAPWSQQGEKWNDDSPKDGILDEIECGYYGWAGYCPDPMGNTIAFAGGVGDPCDPYLCGDCNCDGLFNGADIDPFFLALGDPAEWQRRYPLCDMVCVADINYDGAVNGADIDAFYTALGVGRCP